MFLGTQQALLLFICNKSANAAKQKIEAKVNKPYLKDLMKFQKSAEDKTTRLEG